MNSVSDSSWRVPSRRSTTHNGPRIECRYFMTSFALKMTPREPFTECLGRRVPGRHITLRRWHPRNAATCSGLKAAFARTPGRSTVSRRDSRILARLRAPCGEASQLGSCGFRQLRLFGRHPSNRELFLASDGLLLVKSQAVTTPLAAPFGHFAIQRESQHLAHTEAGCQHDREPAHNEPLMRVGHKFVE